MKKGTSPTTRENHWTLGARLTLWLAVVFILLNLVHLAYRFTIPSTGWAGPDPEDLDEADPYFQVDTNAVGSPSALESGDLDALNALYRDPQIRHFFPEGTLALEETRAELAWHQNGHPEHPELGLWATILKDSGQFIGRCGLLPWHIDGLDEVEIAYLIDKACWMQGYATEAAQGILDYARASLGLSRLVCLIDEHNQASMRVAAKIGMAFDKESRDELGPFHLYALQQESSA